MINTAIRVATGKSSTAASPVSASTRFGDSKGGVGGTAVPHATCERGGNPLSDVPNTVSSFSFVSAPASAGLVTDKIKGRAREGPAFRYLANINA